ncbi:hypothetical protein ACIBUY_04685 [Streptomyces sp. NPDC050085]|uniref:hypothetical protein n=1 Tax=Streptomyces sp. NPDC050085 TaxID=3365600 RepID=UPI0037B0303D
MFDQLSAGGRLRRSAGYEATLPQLRRRETRVLSAWTGTLQLSAFVALLVLPIVLITGAWQAPAVAGGLAWAYAATRRSSVRYLRIRAS